MAAAAAVQPPLRGFIQDVINEAGDRRRMSAGIEACATRRGDFATELEMQLTGLYMMPEARQLMSDALSAEWSSRQLAGTRDYSKVEVVIGGGYHAAVYCANRVAMGFPRPVVLEQNSAEQVGGAYAMSQDSVFWLNSRSRPGSIGLPDQDKALNVLPGAPVQPAMLSSQEYPDNAIMAWLIRLVLAQYATVYPGVTVTGVVPADRGVLRLDTSAGSITPGRVLDARGLGTENAATVADGERILTFSQFMARMGRMFPLRGMQQVAVIGGGNAGLCAVESLLGLAPAHSSAVGLDYVQQVDLYATRVDGQTCDDFRASARGRYIRLAQSLEGNVSNPRTRLRVIGLRGYPDRTPDGVITGDRSYDLAVVCTGSNRTPIEVTGNRLGYFAVQREPATPDRVGSAVLAMQAQPFESYRIGPAGDIRFSDAERAAGIDAIAQNKVSMFRTAPKTAALAVMLKGLIADN